MALQIYSHGNCCGAHIIDGFHDRESYRAIYRRSYLGNPDYRGGPDYYTEEGINRLVERYPTHEEMMRELKDKLDATSTRGQIMVILNQDQQVAWHDTLTNIFGFQLIYSDVANPNHPSTDWHGNHYSRLFTYIWVRKAYQGDRADAGLPPIAEARLGTPTSQIRIPEPPPPPPFRTIPIATLPYGVRI